MTELDKDLKEARRRFTELQTTTILHTSGDDKYQIDEIKRYLLKAGLSVAALDPEGNKTDAEMEAELAAAVKSAHLRTARKNLHELETTTTPHSEGTAKHYIDCIRRALAAAGEGVTALDPAGRQGEAELEARMVAGYRRICLQRARHDMEEFETSACAPWGDLTDHLSQSVRNNLQNAEVPLSAIDPTGASSDADIEKRLAAATRRLMLMNAKDQFEKAEKETSCYSPDSAFGYREKIMKMLAPYNLGLETVGEGASAEEVERRLAAAGKRLCGLGALRVIAKLEKCINGEEKSYSGGWTHSLKELESYLQHAPVEELSATEEGRGRIKRIITASSLQAGKEELDAFEKMSAPKTLGDIDLRARRVAQLFNAAADLLAGASDLGDDPVTAVQKRMDEANARARDLYYAAGGKLPVMKRIKLGHAAGGGT